MPPHTPIAVLGAGSWGTALAILLARNGQPVWLWGRNVAEMAAMANARCNARYLPGIEFPAGLTATHDLAQTLRAAGDVLIAVPSTAFRATLQLIAPHRTPRLRIAWATKGLESGSHKLLHEVVAEELGADVPTAVISGPTFAREVAQGLPTAVTVASRFAPFGTELAAHLHHGSFRAYTSDDVVGVELGGALKNVLAIAAGITDGLGFGANSRAALITRGLAEMMRLGDCLGGRRETFMGLTGLGDLLLTCTDNQSRNRRLGLLLASGQPLDQALASIGQAVEGVEAAREFHALCAQHGVEMPIAEQVYAVLYEGRAPREAVQRLLERDPKPERL